MRSRIGSLATNNSIVAGAYLKCNIIFIVDGIYDLSYPAGIKFIYKIHEQ